MTTVILPDFICNMYEDEVRKIVNQVITHITKRFELDKDTVIDGVEKNVKMNLRIVPESVQTVVIQYKKPVTAENRCEARLKKSGLYCQCSYKRAEDNLCKRHHNTVQKDKLKWGTINDPLPKENNKRKSKVI